MTIVYTGSCLCGQIRYQASNIVGPMAHCHCSMCRKFHGAAFSTFASAGHFVWLSGSELLSCFTAPNGTRRQFCRHCGSSLTFQAAGESGLEFALATLDTPINVLPDAHIWLQNKADWFAVTDDLPQHRAGRDSACMQGITST